MAVKRHRTAARARGIAMVVVGAVIDLCAVINVPGAADFPASAGDEIRVTSFGTIMVLLGIACWLTVLWRDRHPMLVLAAGGFLAIIGVSYLLLLVGTVAAVRLHPGRTRLIGILVSATVVLFAVREALTPWGGAWGWYFGSQSTEQDVPGAIVTPLVVAVLSLAATAGVVFGSRIKRGADESRRRADTQQQRAEELSDQLVRQAERDRIARDMHDSLAHRLSIVSLHAGALAATARDGEAGEIARTVHEQTHAALQDMRGMIGDLRSGPGESSPSTMRAIGPLLADVRRSGVPVTAYVVIEAPERVSAQFDSAVHRIVQEALTNAIKHARGAVIDVFVQVEPHDGARIRVVNPLLPVAPATVPGGGNGLVGIRERTEMLGGTAWIGPHGSEFIVDVTLPWQERV